MCDRLCGVSSASEARCHTLTETPQFKGILLHLRTSPSRERREGKRIAIEEAQESRPDVKAAGCRGENEERDLPVNSRATAPPGEKDVTDLSTI